MTKPRTDSFVGLFRYSVEMAEARMQVAILHYEIVKQYGWLPKQPKREVTP